MQPGDTIYVRYIGNVPHWPKGLLLNSITSVGIRFITLTINGDRCRFDKTNLGHDNRGHRPAYRLYRTEAEYKLEIEREELKHLMLHTDFATLSLAKQRAIRAILQA